MVGGSGALGAAVADLLEERGARVGVTFRSTPVRRTPPWRLDLTDAGACARVVEESVAELGGLHTLVYAAGPHVPMRHLSRVEPSLVAAQLASDAAAFLASPRAGFVTGQKLDVDGGYTA